MPKNEEKRGFEGFDGTEESEVFRKNPNFRGFGILKWFIWLSVEGFQNY
jgi:hypothetical protein